MPEPVLPNLVVNVQFDESTRKFSFSSPGSTRGWEVFQNGAIYPPIVGRVIQFHLKTATVPDDEPQIRLAGFEISADELSPIPPGGRWCPLPSLPPPMSTCRVCSVVPAVYPAEDSQETFTDLVFDLGSDGGWFYRLAVVVGDSELIWDDPKIHDDGSQ
ncbi:MAG TPA: hypothetical protein VGS57_03125 [Thermoanaerobaculia bacterium]|jgi:hypothetical protein|nr:hypothetical protein [Thermoanaerobaculia bacterium]